MSQEQQKKTRSAKNAPQKKQMQKHPNPRRPRGSGGKTAAQVIVSLVLVALVGYEGFHMYRSFTPISQGSESMDLVGGGSESEAATEPKTVYENVSVSNEDVHAGDLILVNTDTAYVEENPTEIVSIYDHKTDNYHVSGTETSLRQPALDALNQMLDAFYVATGHQDMIVISGYRTTQQQQELYDADLAETGEQTSTRVALPGHSEHESGYALDFSLYTDGVQYDYDGTGEYAWINENCAHYGYVLRYAEDKQETTGIQAEPWHYRYVGQPHATYMMENNVCLEEYLTLLKNYTADEPLSITNWDGEIYQVYYVAVDTSTDSTYVMVPPDAKYTISGNNSDGFIVTVDTGEIQSGDAAAATTPEDSAAADTETEAETSAAE
ncbi:D-alanyl-D-alanine carboxypeptidase family protein [Ruminococcus callidus]|uniref:M15 family metallopeptidase n=1 Tax=Ruminococcus TaxID=1263 RepID=UPI0026EF8431|nr:M15 family metallopeptidase [Ruminococcus callidus]MBS4831633.1 M15 family metallopeptidase [Ruminococcus callidus]